MRDTAAAYLCKMTAKGRENTKIGAIDFFALVSLLQNTVPERPNGTETRATYLTMVMTQKRER